MKLFHLYLHLLFEKQHGDEDDDCDVHIIDTGRRWTRMMTMTTKMTCRVGDGDEAGENEDDDE